VKYRTSLKKKIKAFFWGLVFFFVAGAKWQKSLSRRQTSINPGTT
jgi:hypothetical protein